MFNDAEYLTKILVAKYMRYRILGEQEARMGYDASPHIIIEREDLEKQLAALDKQLKKAGFTAEEIQQLATNSRQTSTTRPASRTPPKQTIIIHIPQLMLQSITGKVIKRVVQKLSNILETLPQSIEVKELHSGSIILVLEISDDAALELGMYLLENRQPLHLVEIIDDKNENPYKLTIDKLLITTIDDYREGWILIDNTYELLSVKRISPEVIRTRQLEKAREKIRRAKKKRQFVLSLAGLGLTDVPPELWDLTELRSLSLTRNNLFKLPEGIGSLKNLTKLDLSYNQLMTLPTTLANLKSLNTFDLTSNLVTGVPMELRNLTQLSHFKGDNYLLHFQS